MPAKSAGVWSKWMRLRYAGGCHSCHVALPAGKRCATRALSVRIEFDQPIRSAVTVAGIVGNAFNNSRIRGSTSSTTDPAAVR